MVKEEGKEGKGKDGRERKPRKWKGGIERGEVRVLRKTDTHTDIDMHKTASTSYNIGREHYKPLLMPMESKASTSTMKSSRKNMKPTMEKR